MTTQAQARRDTQADDKSRSGGEKFIDKAFIWLTRLLALGVAAILVAIAVEVAIEAWPAIRQIGWKFITTSAWNPVNDTYGALPMIYGTIATSAVALLFAFPLGVGTAIFLTEDFIPQKVRTILVFLVELIAAIPSVVYGLWGIFVLIPLIEPLADWLHNTLGWFPLFSENPVGPGMFPASIILTIMILPILTAIARDSLASLPPDLRQASLGLGATRWGTIFRVLIPAAFSGIIGGTMLALGRALGETMAVTLIIGNSNDFSLSILGPGNTIASLIANQFAEASNLQLSALMYAGLVLFFITLVVNILAELIVQQVKQYN